MRGALYIFAALIMLLSMPGCLSDQSKDAKKWRITLDPEDKNPYGTYLANQSLKYYFPEATFEPLARGFHYDKMDDKMKQNDYGRSLIVFVGLDFNVSEDEWKELKEFANNGNEIIIFSSSLDEKIQIDLACVKVPGNEEQNAFGLPITDNYNRDALFTTDNLFKRYRYHGRSIDGYFSLKIDSSKTNANNSNNENDTDEAKSSYLPYTLGYANSKPDLVRFRIGEGHIALHAAPLVLSNYFLLQPGNVDYLTSILQTLPKNITKVYTHSYYKRSGEASGLSVLWKYPATKWALLLGIFVLLMYVLFEGKRKQRIIPVIAPLKNDSVSFAETVGRLYYNKGNHANLAGKMTQQFLEWVRLNYFLNTNLLNDEFINQLTIRSGQPENTVRGLIDMIHEIKLGDAIIDDAYLYQLYNTIQQFYKNNRI